MGTSILECGCMISSSMFGKYEILAVQPCIHHAYDPTVQQLMRELVSAMQAAYDHDPGSWNEDGWVPKQES